MMDVTGVKISWALSARNLQVERLPKINPKDIIQKEQLGLWKAFKFQAGEGR